ncbi:hypothetical protein BDY19DRAFT_901601 [Irpex rosettiformis]|uniref:Uncharacterized protein n=1 Tax=Irpex rosettiformis TaxID=378272 RepID=A0ACB8UJV8_9APHY|nr:hypothetical protein BDY19DRAFT_901601 [Irpex rosettiformis]
MASHSLNMQRGQRRLHLVIDDTLVRTFNTYQAIRDFSVVVHRTQDFNIRIIECCRVDVSRKPKAAANTQLVWSYANSKISRKWCDVRVALLAVLAGAQGPQAEAHTTQVVTRQRIQATTSKFAVAIHNILMTFVVNPVQNPVLHSSRWIDDIARLADKTGVPSEANSSESRLLVLTAFTRHSMGRTPHQDIAIARHQSHLLAQPEPSRRVHQIPAHLRTGVKASKFAPKHVKYVISAQVWGRVNMRVGVPLLADATDCPLLPYAGTAPLSSTEPMSLTETSENCARNRGTNRDRNVMRHRAANSVELGPRASGEMQ